MKIDGTQAESSGSRITLFRGLEIGQPTCPLPRGLFPGRFDPSSNEPSPLLSGSEINVDFAENK